MTESSLLWDSGGGGDASPHSEAQTAALFAALFDASGNEGIVPGMLNELVPSTPGAGQVRVASGWAIVDGHPYLNTANVDFTPTTPSVGTTGHRIVARCSWSAQTVRLTDVSSADGTAAIPAMTQTPGTTYDIPILSFTKTTGGVIAIVSDDRGMAGAFVVRRRKLPAATQNFSSTTFANITGTAGEGAGNLDFWAEANRSYRIRFSLNITAVGTTAANGGLKLQFTGPGTIGNGQGVGVYPASQTVSTAGDALSRESVFISALAYGSSFFAVNACQVGTSNGLKTGVYVFELELKNGATAGLVTLQGADNAGTATVTVASAEMTVEKVAS